MNTELSGLLQEGVEKEETVAERKFSLFFSGYSSLVLDSTSSRLYAVCTNDVIYEYVTTNLSTQPTHTYRGHLTSSFYVKATLSPDDRWGEFSFCCCVSYNKYIRCFRHAFLLLMNLSIMYFPDFC